MDFFQDILKENKQLKKLVIKMSGELKNCIQFIKRIKKNTIETEKNLLIRISDLEKINFLQVTSFDMLKSEILKIEKLNFKKFDKRKKKFDNFIDKLTKDINQKNAIFEHSRVINTEFKNFKNKENFDINNKKNCSLKNEKVNNLHLLINDIKNISTMFAQQIPDCFKQQKIICNQNFVIKTKNLWNDLIRDIREKDENDINAGFLIESFAMKFFYFSLKFFEDHLEYYKGHFEDLDFIELENCVRHMTQIDFLMSFLVQEFNLVNEKFGFLDKKKKIPQLEELCCYYSRDGEREDLKYVFNFYSLFPKIEGLLRFFYESETYYKKHL